MGGGGVDGVYGRGEAVVTVPEGVQGRVIAGGAGGGGGVARGGGAGGPTLGGGEGAGGVDAGGGEVGGTAGGAVGAGGAGGADSGPPGDDGPEGGAPSTGASPGVSVGVGVSAIGNADGVDSTTEGPPMRPVERAGAGGASGEARTALLYSAGGANTSSPTREPVPSCRIAVGSTRMTSIAKPIRAAVVITLSVALNFAFPLADDCEYGYRQVHHGS